MVVVFEQVFILFAFALVGYALSRTGLVQPAHGKLLSTLLVYVFLPCNVFKTFVTNCNPAYFLEKYPLILAGGVIVAVMVALARFGAKLFAREDYPRKIYRYTIAVPNYSYMGFALAEGILGGGGLLNTMLFAMGLAVYNYTGAFCMLTKRRLSVKQLLHPVILALVAGMAVGLLQLRVPAVLVTVLDKSSACMGPVSMLLTGIAISEFRLPELLKDGKAYIMTLLRLVVIPVAIGCALIPFRNPVLTQSAVLLFAMPCGLNTIVFPKLVDEDCRIGASLACISNVLACVTIPLVCGLFGIGIL